MKAMILAAGKGERMKQLTAEIPKPMLPIQNRPLLEYSVELLRQNNITNIAINLHHQPDCITQHFGNGHEFGVDITFSYESKLLGSAGAIRKLKDYFDQTFVVLYGDVLTNLKLSELISFHQGKKCQVTIALYRVDDPSSCGIVDIDQDGAVKQFIEKPSREEIFTDLANAGVYVVEPEVIDYIPDGVTFDFGHDLFPKLLEQNVSMYGYPIDAYLIDIGTPEKYQRAQRDVEEGKLQRKPWEASLSQ